MRHLTPLLLAAALLAACAPTARAPDHAGRIVNLKTGAEGVLSLGYLGAGGHTGRATITFGQDVYYGSYNLLDQGRRDTVVIGAGFSFGSGPYGDYPYGSALYPRTVSERNTAPRTGSVIVKDGAGRVISCSLTVDDTAHGNATCEDGAGNKYSAQL